MNKVLVVLAGVVLVFVYTFGQKSFDSVNKKAAQAPLTITVTAGAPPPVNGACGQGTNGQFYSCTFTATGGTPPYDWSIVSGILPPGLTGATSTNVATNDTFTISGIPNVAFVSPPGLFNPPQVTKDTGAKNENRIHGR